MTRPTLCIGVIARNEERDLPRCLKSIAPIADALVLIDTGSTDRTLEVARENWPADKPFHARTYLGASEQDENGNWLLWNFAGARNEAIKDAEATGMDYYCWFDCDDELLDAAPVLRAMYRSDVDAWSMFISAGGAKWLHMRMWKMACKVRFKGLIHEYAIVHHLRSSTCYATIQHHADPHPSQEDSNVRNLRILMREWAENPDARTAFYIGCTHKDAARYAEAAEWFKRRVDMGEGFRDEWLFAQLYLARALFALKDHEHARQVVRKAQAAAPDWAELILQDANIAYADQTYRRAIGLARPAMDLPITPTPLWREPHAYRDRAPRLISWCYEHLGELADAIVWGWLAARRIGGPDADWSNRIARLEAQYLAASDARLAPAASTGASRHVGIKKRRKVALVRPGAIGDILMTLNLIPAFKAANPDTDVHYFCAAQYARPDALLPTMLAAGCDQVLDVAGLDAWRKSYDQVINLVGYQIDWARNERLPMDRHLLEYFAGEMGIIIPRGFQSADGPKEPFLPTLELPRPRTLHNTPYVTLQVAAGWSKYKEWPIDRWQTVVNSFHDVEFVQIGEGDCERLNGANTDKLGVALSESIGIVANASLHIGIDSFANHLTHYRWSGRRVPGVILFGSTQPEVLGYPENINLSAGLPCQQMCYRENPAISKMDRGPCISPKRDSYTDNTPWDCMEKISVGTVVNAIREMLGR